MLSVCLSVIFSTAFATLTSEWATVPCTMNDYEGPEAALGVSLDNAAPWCGQRYSVLNVARVVSISSMTSTDCNQCVEISNGAASGPSVYVLAVDQREAYGLDIASSSYQALFPTKNVLDPETCKFRKVDASYCGRLCVGTAAECTVGVRNSLPGYLLPATPRAVVGLYATGTFGSNSETSSGTDVADVSQPPAQTFAQSTASSTTFAQSTVSSTTSAAPIAEMSSSTASPTVYIAPTVDESAFTPVSVTTTQFTSSAAAVETAPVQVTTSVVFGSNPAAPVYGSSSVPTTIPIPVSQNAISSAIKTQHHLALIFALSLLF